MSAPSKCRSSEDGNACGSMVWAVASAVDFTAACSMRYYYEDANSNKVGPVSDGEVLQLIRDGVLTADTRVMAEHSVGWQSVGHLVRESEPTPDTRPRLPNRCPHCRARLASRTMFCATCGKSDVPHVTAKLASPGKRLAASFIDMLAPGIGAGFLSRILAGVVGGAIGQGRIMTVALLAWAVWSMFLFSNGMTPGKWLMNIYVMDKDGDPAGLFRMMLREWIGKPISMFVMGLGYLWILIDENNQGWHDHMFDTYVVED